jgi:hypothetical protein
MYFQKRIGEMQKFSSRYEIGKNNSNSNSNSSNVNYAIYIILLLFYIQSCLILSPNDLKKIPILVREIYI